MLFQCIDNPDIVIDTGRHQDGSKWAGVWKEGRKDSLFFAHGEGCREKAMDYIERMKDD